MCGIVGAVALSRTAEAPASDRLLAMARTMTHRGPDDEGVYVDPARRAGLAVRRLSIIDIEGGHQPVRNEDGTIWAVLNGEIYNFQTLRQQLETAGHRFRSQTDTEVLVHLYEAHGVDCVRHLRGMFAFAIWDEQQQQLLAARDHLGVKPLYYTTANQTLLFASEIRALLEHAGVSRAMDPASLCHYLTFSAVPAPSTMFHDVHKLPPGHLLLARSGGRVKCRAYWDVAAQSSNGMTFDDAISRLRMLLEESVRLRLVSDRPVGLLLSGGIDSTTNASLMARFVKESFHTFSIGYAGEPAYNELEYSRAVARQLGTRHHEMVLTAEQVLEGFPATVAVQDEPLCDPVVIPFYHLCRFVRDHGISVVQVGEGSDELFCGYELHYEIAMAFAASASSEAPLQTAPVARAGWSLLEQGLEPLSQAGSSLIRRLGHPGLQDLGRRVGQWYRGKKRVAQAQRWMADGYPPFWGGAIAFSEEAKEAFLTPRLRQAVNGTTSADVVNRYYQEIRGRKPSADWLEQMTYLELKLRLAELLLMRVDKYSMAASLEARVPFLDYQLVEFVMGLPLAMKIGDGPKGLLKQAVAGWVPEEILRRPKQPFGVPLASWFRGPLLPVVEETLRESALLREGWLDRTSVERLWRAHLAGYDQSFPLWNLLTLSWWHRRWIEQTDPLPSTHRSADTAPPLKFSHASTMTFISQAVGVACDGLLGIATARFLGPAGRGIWSVIRATVGVLWQLGHGGLSGSATFLISKNPSLRERVVANMLWWIGGIGVVLSLLLTAINRLWPQLFSSVPQHLLWVALGAVPAGLIMMQLPAVWLGQQRFIAYNAFSLLGKLVLLAVIGGALLTWHGDVTKAIWAWVAATNLVALCYLWWAARGQRCWRFDAALFRSMWSYGTISYLSTFLNVLLIQSDVLLVNWWLGTSAAGWYAVSANVAGWLLLLPVSIGTVLFPTIANRGGDPEGFLTKRLMLPLLLGMAAILCIIGVLAHLLIPWLFGPAFGPSVRPLLVLLPGVWCMSLATLLMHDAAGRGRPPIVMVAPAVALVLNLALNIWLIPGIGIVGAAVASSAAYAAEAALMLQWFWRRTRQSAATQGAPAVWEMPQWSSVT